MTGKILSLIIFGIIFALILSMSYFGRFEMIIGNVKDSSAYINTISNNTPSEEGNNLPPSPPQTTNDSSSLNLHNISVKEINNLIKSGELGLGAVPFINPETINAHGVEAVQDMKIDYLGQVEKSVEFSRSIGQPNENMEQFLEQLRQLQGKKSNARVDTYA